MDLAAALLAVGEREWPEHFEQFAAALEPAWIQQALSATGTATVRRRKLPAEQAVWLVIGMGLFRDRSIAAVAQHLRLVLPESTAKHPAGALTSSALVQARQRLGFEPLSELFRQSAEHWAFSAADAQRWRGLAVYGVDGSTLRIADTPENEATLGRPGSRRGGAAYPQLRLVTLMALRAHLLAGLALGPYHTAEATLAETLWDRIPDDSLTILDRGFLNYGALHRLQSQGRSRHWLIRARAKLKWRVLRRLGVHDHLVEVTLSKPSRRADPQLPETLQVRAVRYQRRGFRAQTLLTSLTDSQRYPAAEIAALYHERWELELAFDEIKTHTLEREETLRSRTPARVYQEVWGLAIGYNLVRLAMARAAAQVGLPPLRLGYRHALMLIREFWRLAAITTGPGLLPRRIENLHDELALLVLPPRRQRRYPRAVKIKMSNYPRKR
jgi:hypothetical protein